MLLKKETLEALSLCASWIKKIFEMTQVWCLVTCHLVTNTDVRSFFSSSSSQLKACTFLSREVIRTNTVSKSLWKSSRRTALLTDGMGCSIRNLFYLHLVSSEYKHFDVKPSFQVNDSIVTHHPKASIAYVKDGTVISRADIKQKRRKLRKDHSYVVLEQMLALQTCNFVL